MPLLFEITFHTLMSGRLDTCGMPLSGRVSYTCVAGVSQSALKCRPAPERHTNCRDDPDADNKTDKRAENEGHASVVSTVAFRFDQSQPSGKNYRNKHPIIALHVQIS